MQKNQFLSKNDKDLISFFNVLNGTLHVQCQHVEEEDESKKYIFCGLCSKTSIAIKLSAK